MYRELKDLCAELTAAGVPADIDPRNVRGNGAWVSAVSIVDFHLGGTATVRVDTYLVTPNTGTTSAFGRLAAMLPKALDVLPGVGDVALNVAVELPTTGGGAVPAFRIKSEIEVTL